MSFNAIEKFIIAKITAYIKFLNIIILNEFYSVSFTHK